MMELAQLWGAAEDYAAQALSAPITAVPSLAGLVGDPHEIATYFLYVVLQLAIVACVMRPLESLCPVENWADRDLTRIDRLYTLLKMLVLVPLFTFFIVPLLGQAFGGGGEGDAPLQLERLLPALGRHPVLLFLIYFAIYDLVYYLVHRLQHAVPWWWGLHSLHHSQRRLSCWSNDRDHYLDDLLEVAIIGAVGAAIGVAPVEYAVIVLGGELVEKFSHANVKIGFGPYLDKVLVDPKFHRLHHMRADPSRPGLHNCNFALVFPIWDILFGTALYNEPARPCGVDDPAVDADNELGLLAQQRAGFRRFLKALRGGASKPYSAPGG